MSIFPQQIKIILIIIIIIIIIIINVDMYAFIDNTICSVMYKLLIKMIDGRVCTRSNELVIAVVASYVFNAMWK
jgi:hypothetical protein